MKVASIAAIVLTILGAGLQQPQFRTTVSRVRLVVSVTDEGGPVRGLTQADFIVEDRGDPQNVRVEESADAPLDLVLIAQPLPSVVYTSGRIILDAFPKDSRPGHVLHPPAVAVDEEPVSRVAAGLSAFLGQIESRDRLGVLLAEAPPRRLRPLAFGSPSLDATAFAGTNYAAPFDAIAAALREFPDSDRRRALVAFTNASDFRSIIRFGALAEMARRLGPQFVLVGTPVRVDEVTSSRAMTTSGVQIGDAVQGSASGHIFPAALQLLARRTGGMTVNLGSGDPRRLMAETFTWLRTQYIVSYEPPPGKGWHPVMVKVNRRKATVTVREGYFVE